MTRSHDEPAFPDESSYGMTLRDYFAAKAMQAMLTNEPIDSKPEHRARDFQFFSRLCYEVADAMLGARGA